MRSAQAACASRLTKSAGLTALGIRGTPANVGQLSSIVLFLMCSWHLLKPSNCHVVKLSFRGREPQVTHSHSKMVFG
jgi:hypothetical protein